MILLAEEIFAIFGYCIHNRCIDIYRCMDPKMCSANIFEIVKLRLALLNSHYCMAQNFGGLLPVSNLANKSLVDHNWLPCTAKYLGYKLLAGKSLADWS